MSSVTDNKGSISQTVLKLEGGLVVSCQASRGEPLCAPEHIAALSLSAIAGGARALRLEGVENIEALRSKTDLPLVGITKLEGLAYEERLKQVYITPGFSDAESLVRAGADIVAVDATERPRPDGVLLKDLIARIHDELGVPVWADISSFKEGIAAFEAGADIVSTTLFGYTQETHLPAEHGPGLELLSDLISHLRVPVILEGRVWHAHEVTKAFELGAHAVVVGSAITRPKLITERFVKAIPIRRPRI